MIGANYDRNRLQNDLLSSLATWENLVALNVDLALGLMDHLVEKVVIPRAEQYIVCHLQNQ